MDDVCPWDVVPGPSIEHAIDTTLSHHPISSGVTSSVESQAEEGNNLSAQLQSIEVTRASRKNSSQLDSCSSSSDVSLVVAEVSEHLRKSCSLQHSSSTGKYFVNYLCSCYAYILPTTLSTTLSTTKFLLLSKIR